MSSDVAVLFRGGVGDWFIWLTRIVPILEYHGSRGQEVDLHVVSPWPEAIVEWAEKIDCPSIDGAGYKFRRLMTNGEYSRPPTPKQIEEAAIGYSSLYLADVWRGCREFRDRPRDVPLSSPWECWPWIGTEWHPILDIPPDETRGTVVQVAGNSVGVVCPPGWWRESLATYPKPIRMLGKPPYETAPEDWGCSECIEGPTEVYSAIKGAEVMVGIDSGFRNIAFTTETPTIEVRRSNGKGYPCPEIFSPDVYDEHRTILNLDSPFPNKLVRA